MTTLDDELQDAIERGELEPNKLGGTLAELVEIVRQSRERTEGVFPLPPTWDSVDYAITEIGETIDAQLRIKRNGDKRNHTPNNIFSRTGLLCGCRFISTE